jgi:hypothetical protein
VGSVSATPLSSGPKAAESRPTNPGAETKITQPSKSGVTATALQNASRPSDDFDLKKLSAADLVKTLEHPNNWMRRMARRMLVEKEYIGFPDNEKALEASVIYQTL